MMGAKARSAINRMRYIGLPAARVGICRIRHDRECSRIRAAGRFPWLSRFYDPNIKKPRGLPEPVGCQGGNGNVRLAPRWQEFFDANNSPAARKYVYGDDKKKLDSGWVNKVAWPTVRQLGGWGGAFVVVTRIEGNRAYIRSYDNSKRPEDYAIDFLQQFYVVYTDDTVGLPDCGRCLTFVISNPGEELWMEVDDLTFVRALR